MFQRLHCLRQRQDKVEPKVEAQVPGAQVEVRNPDEHDDDAASEASWLREQLTPTPAVMKVGEEDESSQEEDAQSNASWFEAPFVDDLPPPEAEGAMVADDEPEVEGGVGLDVDLWQDSGGYAVKQYKPKRSRFFTLEPKGAARSHVLYMP